VRLLLQDGEGHLEKIGRGFRHQVEGDRGVAVIGLAILVVLALTFVGWLLARERNDGRRLFKRLSDANGLSRAERRLLAAVAERAGEPNPSALFFRRGLFEDVVADMSPDPEVLDGVRRKVYAP
jgi:hypothetical protein